MRPYIAENIYKMEAYHGLYSVERSQLCIVGNKHKQNTEKKHKKTHKKHRKEKS